jgi:F0F1-type ATP synthase assembly protein I
MSFFRKSDAAMLRTAYELSAGVLSFVVALAIGWWVGRTLDNTLHTSPWLAVTGTVLGVVAGALNVVRTVSRALAPDRQPQDGPSRDGRG